MAKHPAYKYIPFPNPLPPYLPLYVCNLFVSLRAPVRKRNSSLDIIGGKQHRKDAVLQQGRRTSRSPMHTCWHATKNADSLRVSTYVWSLFLYLSPLLCCFPPVMIFHQQAQLLTLVVQTLEGTIPSCLSSFQIHMFIQGASLNTCQKLRVKTTRNRAEKILIPYWSLRRDLYVQVYKGFNNLVIKYFLQNWLLK